MFFLETCVFCYWLSYSFLREKYDLPFFLRSEDSIGKICPKLYA